jgi:hypothetical protein
VKQEALLLVVDDAGRWLGSIGPFACGPHPQECDTLLAAAWDAGIAVTVLRLAAQVALGDTLERRYVVQALHPVRDGTLGPLPRSLPDESRPTPQRLVYARVGGVIEDVRWAIAALRRLGKAPRGWPEQTRTWNLSCVHRIALTDGTYAWLKVVPPFFGHEAAMLRFVADARCGIDVPPLLAHYAVRHRVLLDDVPGELMWRAQLDDWLPVVERYVETQFALRSRVAALRGLGASDWRRPAFCAAVKRLVARADVRATLRAPTLAGLDELVSDLDVRMARIADCALPESLVHGDFHRGNVIASPTGARIVLDWGDAGVGHLVRCACRLPWLVEADAVQIRDCMVRTWRALIPGSDPAGAWRPMARPDGVQAGPGTAASTASSRTSATQNEGVAGVAVKAVRR